MAEYKTLADVKQAMDKGELTDPVIVLDNDCSYLMVNGEDVDSFDVHPHDLMEQALDLLGIKHEHV